MIKTSFVESRVDSIKNYMWITFSKQAFTINNGLHLCSFTVPQVQAAGNISSSELFFPPGSRAAWPNAVSLDFLLKKKKNPQKWACCVFWWRGAERAGPAAAGASFWAADLSWWMQLVWCWPCVLYFSSILLTSSVNLKVLTIYMY